MTEEPDNLVKLREACRSSYAVFCHTFQEEGYFDSTHELLCDTIQAELDDAGVLASLRTGVEPLRDVKLNIIMPRSSLKSTIVTKYLPVWLTIQPDPKLHPELVGNMRTLICMNSAPNASKKIDDIRGLVDGEELFAAMFPEVLPGRNSRWSSLAAEFTRARSFPEATFESAGVKTKVISRHYNAIFEDDTLAPDESDSKADMALPSVEDTDKAIGWHKLAAPLLVPRGVRIRLNIGTRWSDFDLIQHILDKEPGYKTIDIPARMPDGKLRFTFSPVFTKEGLDQALLDLGEYLFSALYLNTPIPAGDRLFRKEWFHYYVRYHTDESGTRDTVPEDANYYVSIDPAISEKDSACETAIVGCFHKMPLIYVNDCVHGHFTPSETILQALKLVEANYDRCAGISVEVNQYQKALAYFLYDEMRRRRIFKPVFEVRSSTAKEVRISGLQPLMQNGQILFSKTLDKVLETQLIQFPHGRLVDCADSLAQQLEVYRGVSIAEKQKPREDTNPHSLENCLKEIRSRSKTPAGFHFREDNELAEITFGSN